MRLQRLYVTKVALLPSMSYVQEECCCALLACGNQINEVLLKVLNVGICLIANMGRCIVNIAKELLKLVGSPTQV